MSWKKQMIATGKQAKRVASRSDGPESKRCEFCGEGMALPRKFRGKRICRHCLEDLTS